MGAGKSTLGREVAARLGRPFLDVDEEVERAEGPIWELFEQQGEAAFRELEARFLREAAGSRSTSRLRTRRPRMRTASFWPPPA